MDEFWRMWAAHQVETQWPIYRDDPFPGVESVQALVDPFPTFHVTLKGGDLFQVTPSAIAKPTLRSPHAVR